MVILETIMILFIILVTMGMVVVIGSMGVTPGSHIDLSDQSATGSNVSGPKQISKITSAYTRWQVKESADTLSYPVVSCENGSADELEPVADMGMEIS